MKSLRLPYFQFLLFLLVAVPCAIPFRYQPNPVFPSELVALFLAALMILGGAFFTSPKGEHATLPWTSVCWLALTAVLGLQMLLLPTPYMSEHSVPMLYLLTAGLSVWALSRAKAEFGAAALMQVLACGLLAGALFNSILGAVQLAELFQNGWRLIYGNIGQKNIYGHYLAWGLAALAWLVSERKLPVWVLLVLAAGSVFYYGLLFSADVDGARHWLFMALSIVATTLFLLGAWLVRHKLLATWVFWPIAVWLALSMAWCSSRSVLFYAVIWLPFGLLIAGIGRDQVRRFGFYLAAAASLILLMQFIAPLINDVIQGFLHSTNDAPTGIERLTSNGARRLVEWKKAWLTFSSHPILGVGWGAYAAQSVALHVAPEFAKVQESVLFTHCHNSLLNLLAETGILGTGVVLAGLAYAYFGVWRQRADSIVLFATAAVSVSIVHSLLEYPLWYYHLLGPFVVLLFFMRADGPQVRIPSQWLTASFAAIAGILLVTATVGALYYKTIYPILEPSDNEAENAANITALDKMRDNPLLDFYVEFALSNYIEASQKQMAWKLAVLRRLNSLRPYPGQLTDQAVMEALSGNEARAHQLIRQAAYAYPESFDYFYQTINHFEQPAVQALLHDVDEAREFFKIKKPDLAANGEEVTKP